MKLSAILDVTYTLLVVDVDDSVDGLFGAAEHYRTSVFVKMVVTINEKVVLVISVRG